MITAKRFASTAAAQSAYLPSVSWLIQKHKLSSELVSTIPTSGPKNRLLKGDVLAFLLHGHDHLDLDVLLSSESYFSIQIPISGSKSVSEIGNLVSLAAISELQDLNPKSTVSIISKKGILDQTDYSLDIAALPKLSIRDLEKLRGQSYLPSAPGSLRIIDSLALGNRFDDTVHHISNGELAILSIRNSDNQKASFSDLFNVAPQAPSSTISPSHVPAVSQDLLDFLAPTHSILASIQVELTADSRVVSNKMATAFLEQIKSTVQDKLKL